MGELRNAFPSKYAEPVEELQVMDYPAFIFAVVCLLIFGVPIGLVAGLWYGTRRLGSRTLRQVVRGTAIAVALAPALVEHANNPYPSSIFVVPFPFAALQYLLGAHIFTAQCVLALVLFCAVVLSISFFAPPEVLAARFSSPGKIALLSLACPVLLVLTVAIGATANVFSLMWTGAAAIGWGVFLIFLTRHEPIASARLVWPCRLWLAFCVFQGVFGLVAGFAAGAMSR